MALILPNTVKAVTVDVADKAGRGNMITSNEAHSSIGRQFDPFNTGNLYIGYVTRSDAGLYDVLVDCGGGASIPCMVGVGSCDYIFGTVDCYIPAEGSKVMVYKGARSSSGVILAVLPAANTLPAVGKNKKRPHSFTGMLDIEPSASACTEAVYSTIWFNPKDMSKLNTAAGRPIDLFPGNKAMLNEQGVGLAVLNLLATLKATDRARIDVSLVDDLVRMISGYYQHINSQGEHRIYNDGGFVTDEVYGTSYQCERSGFTDYNKPIFEVVKEKAFLNKSTSSKFKMIKANAVARKRFQIFLGYLGDVLNMFVANPDPKQDPMISPDDSTKINDQGLMQLHVDGSGRLLARSISGFLFQRADKIAIPQRKREPWDPEGDKMEDSDPVTEKKEAEFNKEFPYGRSLQLRDAAAWYNRQAVRRLDDQKKDIYLPEEKDLETPQDEYDKQGKAKSDFSKNVNKQNFLDIGSDGSLTLRDAWGSCITLRGGCIDITCAGDITLRSGKNVVTLAGHDAVIKARKSVDVTATDNDLRLKAEGNLQMVCEGRNGVGGGILIESCSRSDNANFAGKGEQARGSGIVLKAESSRVFATGRVVHLASDRNILLDGFNDAGVTTGSLLVGMRSVGISARAVIDLCVGDKTGLVLGKRSAAILAPSIALESENSVNILKGSQAWIPLMLADLTYSPYDQTQPAIAQLNDRIQNSTQWVEPYTPDIRMTVQFTYRSSSEYGTTKASEVDGAVDFYTYQAPWAYMANKQDPLIQVVIDKWEEFPIADTYPWPGADVYNSDAYVQLQDEVNIFDPATGLPKERKLQTNVLGGLKAVNFNEYEVVK